MDSPQTTIWRHRRENLKKCSLRGLEGRPDLQFLTYPVDPLPELSGHLFITPDAPLLTPDDTSGLFFIDATWRLAAVMEGQVDLPNRRSLPNVPTAYPRRQTQEGGLATVEALYLAYLITGRDPSGLLDHYYWKNEFLQLCKDHLILPPL